jgi:probable blue pigment (indigoidine) exporter
MEDKWRWLLLTAIAPIAWGSVYFVTSHWLPADQPLWGSALRALPAGLVLLLIARRAPRDIGWWRTIVLGVLNVGGFFLLLYIASQLLPTSVAASIMAASPLVFALLGWLLLGQSPAMRMFIGAGVGILGVVLLVGGAVGAIDGWGVAASMTGLLTSAVAQILTRRWGATADPITATGWQLVVGGALLTTVAIGVEGPPPALDASGWLAIAYVGLIGTAIANVVWFVGLEKLPAGTVGIIGLLNPVTGVLLGVLLGGEHLGALQAVGIALALAGIIIGQRRATRTPLPAAH